MVYISQIEDRSGENQTTHGFVLLFERELKKTDTKSDKKVTKKIHLVKLTSAQTGKKIEQKVDCIDTLIFKKPVDKKISISISGQSLIILMTDIKVKSQGRKARLHTFVVSYSKTEEGSPLTPMFLNQSEWAGELREHKVKSKKILFVCILMKQKKQFLVYVGYGSDCTVFNPIFDKQFYESQIEHQIYLPVSESPVIFKQDIIQIQQKHTTDTNVTEVEEEEKGSNDEENFKKEITQQIKQNVELEMDQVFEPAKTKLKKPRSPEAQPLPYGANKMTAQLNLEDYKVQAPPSGPTIAGDKKPKPVKPKPLVADKQVNARNNQEALIV